MYVNCVGYLSSIKLASDKKIDDSTEIYVIHCLLFIYLIGLVGCSCGDLSVSGFKIVYMQIEQSGTRTISPAPQHDHVSCAVVLGGVFLSLSGFIQIARNCEWT